MASISITVNDVSVELAQKIVSLVHGTHVIKPEDRPDAGTEKVILSNPVAVAVPQSGGAATPPNPFAAQSAPAAPASVPIPPTPAVPAAVPVAPSNASGTVPAASTAPASGVEVDSRGLPWDPRIHASTQSKTQKGVWTAKRGLNDEAMVLRVEQELRAAMAARAPAQATTAAASPAAAPALPPSPVVTAAGAAVGLPITPPGTPAPPAAPTEALPSTASSNAASPVPAAPPAPTPAAQPSAAIPAPAGETFGMLMARLAPLLQTDAAKAAKINEALGAFGLQSLAGLASRADLVVPFAQTVDVMLAAA